MILIFYLWIMLQIVGELLPISSSSHVYLLQAVAEKSNIFLDQFIYPLPLKTVYYFLHGFTLLLLTIFLAHYFLTRKISFEYIKNTALNIFVADTITVFLYLIIHYYDLKIPISLGLFITILILFSLYVIPKSSFTDISLSQAAILGTVQGISLLPGISRLASTYTAARWLRVQSMPAFIFSWLMQLPLIVLAFGNSLIHITKAGGWENLLNLPMACVIVISSVIAWYALLIMVRLVANDRVDIFGWYMIVPLVISLMM